MVYLFGPDHQVDGSSHLLLALDPNQNVLERTDVQDALPLFFRLACVFLGTHVDKGGYLLGKDLDVD